MITETERNRATAKNWKQYQKIAFRIAFPFFIMMCVPLSASWYDHFFHIDWTSLHCRDLYDIAMIRNKFADPVPGWWGFGSYIDWGIALLVAIVIGGIWTIFDKNRQEYNQLYKWLRVLVRYRVALGVIGFSFEKIFPTQMPYPTLSNLATDFGDLNGHKLFWTSVGIVPSYETFSGIIEFVPGVMLLFRRTATLGAILICAVMLNVVFVNFGFNYNTGGIHVYASYFVLLTLFLLIHNISTVYKLIVQEQKVIPVKWYPSLDKKWLKYVSVGVKVLFGIYCVLFAYLYYLNFRYDPYKMPSIPGVKQLYGYYEVIEFRINNMSIPYSPLDSVRWQDVTFERWRTLTYRVNKEFIMSTSSGRSNNTGHPDADLERAYEINGVAGGRRAFHYYHDSANHVLYLLEKKRSVKKKDPYPENWISAQIWKNIGGDNHKIHPRAWSARRDRYFASMNKDIPRDKMILNYTTEDGSKVILKGTDENRDSIYIVLQRKDRKFTLPASDIQSGYYEYNK